MSSRRSSDRWAAPSPPPTPVISAGELSTPPGQPRLSDVIQHATTAPLSLAPADAIQLQRTLGNATVGRLLADDTSRDNRTGLPDRLKPESRPCPAWRWTLQFDARGEAPI